MITNFGKTLRKIRLIREETLYDMAKKLEITSSYLSAIECGKRNIPEDFIDKLQKIYDFTEEELVELKTTKEDAIKEVSINIENIGLKRRTLALEFARSFGDIADEDAEKLIKRLRKLQGKE